jgi:membrane fusion protein, multidrug efflux system
MTSATPRDGATRRRGAIAVGAALLAAVALAAWLSWPAPQDQAASAAPPPIPVVLATAEAGRLVREAGARRDLPAAIEEPVVEKAAAGS